MLIRRGSVGRANGEEQHGADDLGHRAQVRNVRNS